MDDLRKRRLRSGVITACILLTMASAIWFAVNVVSVALGGVHKDWFVHVTAESLVEHSEHIVLARYVDAAVHEIPNSSRDPAEVLTHKDIYRRFEVAESLKGDFQPGDSVYVGWNAGYSRVDPLTELRQFTPRLVTPLAQGEVYGLFLNLSPSRSRHPDDAETRIWKTPDGLEVALVEERGRFAFQTDQFYRNALKDMGLKPVGRLGTPFELTIHDVRRLVASGPGNSSQ